jgi:hypothetical protein
MVRLMVLRYKQIDLILLLKFAFLDLCALTLFVTFLVSAVVSIRRNDTDTHASYMAGTVLFTLEPALERVFVLYVPGVSGFASALYFALITMELIVLVLLYFERIAERHPDLSGGRQNVIAAQSPASSKMSIRPEGRLPTPVDNTRK